MLMRSGPWNLQRTDQNHKGFKSGEKKNEGWFYIQGSVNFSIFEI